MSDNNLEAMSCEQLTALLNGLRPQRDALNQKINAVEQVYQRKNAEASLAAKQQKLLDQLSPAEREVLARKVDTQ